MSVRRGALLLLLALGACAPQHDLIALRHMVDASCADGACRPCDSADSCGDPRCADAASCPPAAPSCDTADSCTNDARCAGAASCPPPPPSCGAADSCTNDPRCADAAICLPPPPSGSCKSRSCSALASQGALCASEGPVLALGDICASPDDNPRFRYVLCSLDSVQTQKPLTVEGDIAADGDVSIEDSANIAGALYYTGALRETRPGLLSADQTERGSARCTPPEGLRLDIAALVKAHINDNDNAAVRSSIEQLRHFTGDLSVTLPCGRYYVTGLEGNGGVTIRAQGHVALFIDGNVQLEKRLTVEAEGTARVSLVVNGAFNVARGGLGLGKLADARHLLLVARQVHLEAEGDSVIGGALYAPASELLSTHKLSVFGSLFVGSARLFGETNLSYAPAVSFAADSCGI